ncbi:related to GAP1 - General amino acid permease [Cephalotrichum gorgonifer]|uniref:Related to GAP1 - General amino acid permease n=1 Tax=Cephalotrichum gorgonifer TaxID=2041049 RepID=A0AAE8MSA9_9PEZI|nr:related to GAP1 - General amino acid permease [Cephalotrichum gorgonifer]
MSIMSSTPGEIRTPRAPSDGGKMRNADKLERHIDTRQMVFMALASGIGAGLFVASGSALSAGGPASVFINYALVGSMVCTTMGALGELATTFPVAGGFYDYADRFLSEHWGFAVGWMYIIGWITVLPFELTTVAAQLQFWAPSLRPEWIIGPLLTALSVSSFVGSGWFGEVEHWLGVGKVLACVVFMIFSIITASGGVPSDTREPKPLGFEYFRGGNAFRNGFAGFLAVFRIAGLSYNGTEVLAMTARECKNPKKAMPVGTYLAFFRISVFYLGCILCLGLTVPSSHPELSQAGHGVKVSPFTLSAKLAGVPGLAHFYAAMILAALASMANTAVFATSRAMQALCDKGCGPEVLARVNARGIPHWSVVIALSSGLLAFISAAPGGEVIFDWLLSIASTFCFYIWIAICASHIRCRRALGRDGTTTASLAFVSPFGVYGSYYTIALASFALLANPLCSIFHLESSPVTVESALRENVGMLVPWLLWGGRSLYCVYRNRKAGVGNDWALLRPMDEVDIDTKRVEKDTPVGGIF